MPLSRTLMTASFPSRLAVSQMRPPPWPMANGQWDIPGLSKLLDKVWIVENCS